MSELIVKSLRIYKRSSGVLSVYYKLTKENECLYGEYSDVDSINFPGECYAEEKNLPLDINFAKREAAPFGYTYVRRVAILWRKWSNESLFMVKADCLDETMKGYLTKKKTQVV